jgi:fatty-acid peroxygenase
VTNLPRDRRLDSTLSLLREGYAFIGNCSRRLHSDVFETRLLLRKTICLYGEEAAKLFYDDTRFRRRGAAPRRAQRTLLGRGGVQGKDGAEHRSRKRMFMALFDDERTQELVDVSAEAWLEAIDRWRARGRVVLLPEVEALLCRAVCRWAGVPLAEADVRRRNEDLHALIDGAGALGGRYLRARRARRRSERWLSQLIRQVREGELRPGRDTALAVIASHREPTGRLMPARVAAVELLNVLRPTVAVAYYVAFAALALHQYPLARPSIALGDPLQLEWFVHEVRRFYPFFPFAVARVRKDFEWRGLRFRRGRRALLDLYGTDHDPRSWHDPKAFRPERFRDHRRGAFNFIPQGGGDHEAHHRCAGERVTIELLKTAVAFLVHGMSYRVPEQDLRVDLARMPAMPASGFVIEDVRPRKALELELPPEWLGRAGAEPPRHWH